MSSILLQILTKGDIKLIGKSVLLGLFGEIFGNLKKKVPILDGKVS